MFTRLLEKEGFFYAEARAKEAEFKELFNLAYAAMRFHIKELNLDLGLPVNLTWSQPLKVTAEDSVVRAGFLKRHRFHVAAYLAEVAMHIFLGNDWCLVFEYNKRYSRSDGVLKDGVLYDVYTRSQNRWGLSKKPKEAIQVYVLTHYYRNHVFLVGYATFNELTRGEPEKRGCFSVPINNLHPICFLKRDYRLGLNLRVSERQLFSVQRSACGV